MLNKSSISKSKMNYPFDEDNPTHITSIVNKANQGFEFQPTQHQNMISNYLETTQFESIMTSAFKELFEGDLIPKNPYPKLIRSLNTTNTEKEVLRNFSERVKYVVKNVIMPEGPYGITSIKGREMFFGLKHILEWVDLERLANVRKGLLELLPDYQDEFNGMKLLKLIVSSSVSGGYLMHSKVLPYPESSPSPLEITSEVFVEGNDLQKAMKIFTDFVYDDIKSITNVQAYHIFRYFRIELFDEQLKKEMVKIWNIQDILAQQHGFTYDLQRAVSQKKKVLMKIFLKTARINFQETLDAVRERKPDTARGKNYFSDGQFDKNFQFIDTFKYYNFHYTDGNKNQTSFAFHPLRSLLKGVFLDQGVAEKYASFFYRQNEKVLNCKQFKTFIDIQLANILPKWKDRNLLFSAWEFFYVALPLENEDIKRKVLDNLIQLLSSDYAYLFATTRVNKVLTFLVIAYRLKTFPFYKFAANETFKIYCSLIGDILAKGGTSEIIIFRDFILRALNSITEQTTQGIDIHMDTNRIIKTVYRLTKAIAESNIQIASIFGNSLSNFMFQTFLKAKTIEQKNLDFITYEGSLTEKLPKKVLHISAEMKANPSRDREEQLFFSYINEYELYDFVFLTIQEMFLSPQLPNPIPTTSFKMEYQAYKFQLKDIPTERLKSLLNEPTTNQVFVNKTMKFPNIFVYVNDFMASQNLPPVIGLRDLITITSVNECSSLKTYLDNLHWRKSVNKANPSYEIADVLTINPVSMISHAAIVKRRYAEWIINYDFVIRGPNFEKAAEVFFDIFLRYAQWLENVEDVHVLGFFDGQDITKPFLDINVLLKNFTTPEPRNFLRNYFGNNRRVMLKFISVVEGHFKIIGMYLNMHYLEAPNAPPKSLLARKTVDEIVKVFFKPEDFILWNKIFPFEREQALALLNEQIQYMKVVGKLNYGYKLEIIKAALEDNSKLLLKLFRGLFGIGEPFYLAAKEMEAFRESLAVLEKVQANEQVVKKLDLKNTQEFFDDVHDNIKKKLLAYENYSLEGIHQKILNLMTKIQSIYTMNGEVPYGAVIERVEKVIIYCLSVGDAAYLSFESNIVEKERLRNDS